MIAHISKFSSARNSWRISSSRSGFILAKNSSQFVHRTFIFVPFRSRSNSCIGFTSRIVVVHVPLRYAKVRLYLAFPIPMRKKVVKNIIVLVGFLLCRFPPHLVCSGVWYHQRIYRLQEPDSRNNLLSSLSFIFV
jgi:hypothetical protein